MRRHDQRGSTTLMVTASAGVLLFTGLALAVVGGVVVAQREAQAAADLVSLAGAAAIARGSDACSAAAVVATANDAELSTCEVSGREVLVGVTVTGPHPMGRRLDVTALARAGPAASGDAGG